MIGLGTLTIPAKFQVDRMFGSWDIADWVLKSMTSQKVGLPANVIRFSHVHVTEDFGTLNTPTRLQVDPVFGSWNIADIILKFMAS